MTEPEGILRSDVESGKVPTEPEPTPERGTDEEEDAAISAESDDATTDEADGEGGEA